MFVTKKNNRFGFSLIELLIAMAISGVVFGAIISTFVTQRKTYDLQEQLTEMKQNARAAMEVLSRTIRTAGYNPTAATFDAVTYHATQLQVKADLNSDGDTADSGEDVTFSHDASNKQIVWDLGGGTQPLADRIETFTFAYLDSDGNATTTNSDISQIQLTITATTGEPDPSYASNGGYRTYTLTSMVTVRN